MEYAFIISLSFKCNAVDAEQILCVDCEWALQQGRLDTYPHPPQLEFARPHKRAQVWPKHLAVN